MRNKPSKAGLAVLFSFFLLAASLKPSSLQAQPTDPGIATSVDQARAAGVPEVALNRVLLMGVDHGLTPEDLKVFLLAFQIVREEDMPIGPFVGKIDEGLAKGVPPQTIARVLWLRIDEYRFVRQALVETNKADQPHQSISHEDLIRIVASLDAGVSREEFTSFMKRAPAAPMSMLARTAEVLALLKQIRFDETLAEEILFTGLRNRSFTQSWAYLAKVVSMAKHKGATDHEIAIAAQAALREKYPLKEFMAALGFTSRDVRHGPAPGRPNKKAP